MNKPTKVNNRTPIINLSPRPVSCENPDKVWASGTNNPAMPTMSNSVTASIIRSTSILLIPLAAFTEVF